MTQESPSPSEIKDFRLTRHGLALSNFDPKLKRELTVRPADNALGFRSPSFKVFRETTDLVGRPPGGGLTVPRYFAPCEATKDSRVDPVRAPRINFVGKLREATRQPEAFAAGLKAFQEQGGGVLSLPCGYGKSAMALAFSAHLKVRTLIVVHKEFLANQWIEKIKEFCPGATIGRVQGSEFDIEKDFVIGMIQTLCQRPFPLGAFDSIGLLVVDEAHHIGAPAFSQCMFTMCPKYTLGLTATPERKDGLTRLLYWFLGPEFFRVERTGQRSTQVKIIHYEDPRFKSSPPVTRFDKINMAGMINELVELEPRNQVIIDFVHKVLPEGRKVLLLSDRRDHCSYFHTRIKASGLYVGGMKESDLEESSKKQVVIATFQLAHEGLDIPALDTVILTTPKSDIKQAIGRIMREGGSRARDPLIVDVVDHWSVCFAMHNKRKAVYRELGATIEGAATEDPEPVPKKGQCLFI
jgi:superfamily II DNA or RNA helicase